MSWVRVPHRPHAYEGSKLCAFILEGQDWPDKYKYASVEVIARENDSHQCGGPQEISRNQARPMHTTGAVKSKTVNRQALNCQPVLTETTAQASGIRRWTGRRRPFHVSPVSVLRNAKGLVCPEAWDVVGRL